MRYLTPGPTEMHPQMEEFFRDALADDICSISHRSEEYMQLHADTTKALRSLLKIPDSFHVFFLGSATEAMERVIQNCVVKKSFHFVNGVFSSRMYETAVQLRKDAVKCEVPKGEGFDLSKVVIPETELICITQNETSTGVQFPMEDVAKLHERHPDTPIVIDIVSSIPYVEINWECVRGVFFSVQKGLRMPAGLGVLIVSDELAQRARRVEQEGGVIGAYHNFPTLVKKEAMNQTPETPNILGIYLLGRVLHAYKEYGLARIRADTDERADKIYSFFDAHETFVPFVKEKRVRSRTVPALCTPEGSGPVIEKVKKAGILIGGGYGKMKEEQIRIANFPMQDAAVIEKVLDLLR